MQQSRLIKYIQALPGRERERFRQFVHSPYFNQHEKTQDLLGLILRSLEEGARPLKREAVFSKLFPGEPYEEQKLHNVMSYLMKLYHRFLAVEHLEKRPFVEELYTLEEAYDLNQFELLTNRARQLTRHLENIPHCDAHQHFIQYRLYHTLGYYTTGYVNRSDSANLQKMLDHLDRYFLASKLKHSCNLTANMILMNTQYDFAFLEPLLRYIETHWDIYGAEPSIDLYYTILLSLREEDNPAHYEHLKELMANRVEAFSPEERADLYEFSQNYCIRQINIGRSRYQRELFRLYEQGLHNGLLLVNGLLSEWMYKNITTLACQLREFEWTKRFIEEYRDKLPANRQENAYAFNLATLYYSKQMYEETLDILQRVQFTDSRYHIHSYFLMLRTYYDMHATEVLLSHLETFRIYVIRSRNMTTEEKRGYTNFLRYAKKLILLKHQASTYSRKALREKLDALSAKIRDTPNVINRSWLLEECRLETRREEV